MTLSLKYINGTLKDKFGLDATSKPKPVAGPDDLLLLLAQHWARDESVFPTEDDRHDVATILLFQSYTGGRLVEFVHSSKGKASQDTLGEAEATANENERCQTRADEDYDGGGDAGDGLEYDNNSDAGDGPEYDDDDLFDYDNDDDDIADEDDLFDDGTDESGDLDSGYITNRTDVTMTEDTDNCYATKIDESGEPGQQNCDAADPDEFREAIRKYKALCYEDICLWIVKNLKEGERDLLAMEVHLRHHKGVDNKPKLYVALTSVPNPG
jgi:hypothetical protein